MKFIFHFIKMYLFILMSVMENFHANQQFFFLYILEVRVVLQILCVHLLTMHLYSFACMLYCTCTTYTGIVHVFQVSYHINDYALKYLSSIIQYDKLK